MSIWKSILIFHDDHYENQVEKIDTKKCEGRKYTLEEYRAEGRQTYREYCSDFKW